MTIKSTMMGYKYKLFPEFIYFSDEQEFNYIESVKETSNISNISYRDWFWFHPSAYSLMYYGVDSVGILTFGAVSFILFYVGWWLFGIFPAIIVLLFLYDLIKKMMNPPNDEIFYERWFK